MAGFTNAIEAALLDHVMNDGAYTPPTSWWLALSTTTPTEAAGNFTEPATANGYARVAAGSGTWDAAVGADPSTKANGSAFTFPAASGSNWGTITHFGLFTASAGGTLGMWGALTASKAVDVGDIAEFAVGQIVLKLGDPADSY